jgi:hypothetical protein
VGRRGESADVPENNYILLAAPPRVRNGHQPQSIDPRIVPVIFSSRHSEIVKWLAHKTTNSAIRVLPSLIPKLLTFFFHVKLFFLTRGGAASNM